MKIFIKTFIFLFLTSTTLFAQEASKSVFVADRDIAKGAVIKEADVTVKNIPFCDLQRDALEQSLQITKKEVFGDGLFTALTDIPKGTQLLKTAITPSGELPHNLRIYNDTRLYPVAVEGSVYAMFEKDNYADIYVVSQGAAYAVVKDARVVDKYEMGSGYYLYLAVSAREAQYIYLSEFASIKMHFVLTRKLF